MFTILNETEILRISSVRLGEFLSMKNDSGKNVNSP